VPQRSAARRLGEHQLARQLRPREIEDVGRRVVVGEAVGIVDDDPSTAAAATQRRCGSISGAVRAPTAVSASGASSPAAARCNTGSGSFVHSTSASAARVRSMVAC